MVRYVRFVEILLVSQLMVMYLLPVVNVLFQWAVLVMSMSKKMETSHVLSARLDTRGIKVGSAMVDGDDDKDGVDDLDNEFNYAEGHSKARHPWPGEDADLSSSSSSILFFQGSAKVIVIPVVIAVHRFYQFLWRIHQC